LMRHTHKYPTSRRQSGHCLADTSRQPRHETINCRLDGRPKPVTNPPTLFSRATELKLNRLPTLPPAALPSPTPPYGNFKLALGGPIAPEAAFVPYAPISLRRKVFEALAHSSFTTEYPRSRTAPVVLLGYPFSSAGMAQRAKELLGSFFNLSRQPYSGLVWGGAMRGHCRPPKWLRCTKRPPPPSDGQACGVPLRDGTSG
jgi:hypothetical protein